MDDFIKSRLGILILVIMGLFGLPFGTLLHSLGLPAEWLTFILGAYGAVALFCEEVVRYYFKLPKEADPPQ